MKDKIKVTLHWSVSTLLESTNAVTGPWLPNTNVFSPYSIETISQPKFYRLQY